MAVRFGNDNQGKLVDRYINTAYDVVKIVSDNIGKVTTVEGYITGGEIDAAIAASISTAADLVLTNADVVLTNADVVTTNADVVLTNADVVLTNADVVTVQGIYDQFDDRYLGDKATPPTVDNDGNTLLTGALYWNSAGLSMYVWTGAAWAQAYNASLGISDTATSVKLYVSDNEIYSLGRGDVTGNTAFGNGTFSAGTTGGHNAAFGLNALNSLTGGAFNVAIGALSLFSSGASNGNVALGYQALSGINITNSSSNVGIGYHAALSVTDSFGSVYIGASAGQNAEGDYSVYVGFQAGNTGVQVSLDHVVAIGAYALQNISTGIRNTVVGYTAGQALTTGQDNVIIGHSAGASADTAASTSVFVGYRAGQNAAGFANVFIGYESGSQGTQVATNNNVGVGAFTFQQLTTGDNNIAVGHSALNSVATTSDNIAIGSSALAQCTGQRNTAVGGSAATALTGGEYNTVIGYQAGAAVSTSVANVAVGANSLLNNTVGWGNTVIGSYALQSNSSGDTNTVVGYAALINSATTDSLVGVGAHAGQHAVGVRGTYLGFNSGRGAATNCTGTDNTCVGYDSLYSFTTGTSNIAIGVTALGTLTTGINNIGIGSSSGNIITTGDYNICIGVLTSTGTTNALNRIVIGDGIGGTLDDQVSIGKVGNIVSNDFGTDAAWTRASDIRKKNIHGDSTLGLDFIKNLNTIKYTYKPTSEWPEEWGIDPASKVNTTQVIHGMVAQDVKAALDIAGVNDFAGWKVDDNGHQKIAESVFIYPLIRAIQELAKQVEALTK